MSNVKGKWRENSNFTITLDAQTPKILKSSEKNVLISNQELSKIKEWIILNYDDLMLLWWLYEHNSISVKDEDTGEILKMDDIFDRLKKI